MGELKEYISCAQADGIIHISQDVIATIAAVAVCEVEGVFALGSAQGGKKATPKGVRLTVTDQDEINIECNVVTVYGYSVVDIAKNIQESVCLAIESMTALKVASVDVNISGISIKK